LKELKIGLRISKEEGLSFFGIDEVNKEIAKGAKVIEIKKGDALMSKKEENQENVRLSLSGFTVIVVISDKNEK
jgi:hypothetical protein